MANGFLPGARDDHELPRAGGPGVRVDSGVVAGSEISPLYDPMIAKLVVHGVDREHARRRMLRALDEFVIEGVKTLIGFHKALLTHPCFVDGETCHGLVESELLAARAAELDNGGGVGQPARLRPRFARRFGPSRSTAVVSRCVSCGPNRHTRSSGVAGANGRAAPVPAARG